MPDFLQALMHKAYTDQLMLGEFLPANKSEPTPSNDVSVMLSVSLCLASMSSGSPTLLLVLQNCFRNYCCILCQLGIEFSSKLAYQVKATPFIDCRNNCNKSVLVMGDLVITGKHIKRK